MRNALKTISYYLFSFEVIYFSITTSFVVSFGFSGIPHSCELGNYWRLPMCETTVGNIRKSLSDGVIVNFFFYVMHCVKTFALRKGHCFFFLFKNFSILYSWFAILYFRYIAKWFSYIYTYTFFFRLFSYINYYRILSSSAIQWVLVAYYI